MITREGLMKRLISADSGVKIKRYVKQIDNE